MATAKTSEWPPQGGLSTPTVHRKDAVSTTAGVVRINAPAKKVFDVLLNVGDYANWNSWIPNVTIRSQPDGTPADAATKLHSQTRFTFHVIMDAAKPQSTTATELMVSDISTPEQPTNYISGELLSEEHGFTSDPSKIYRVSWKSEGGFVSMGLRTERFHEVIPLGENECEVRTWEVMGGPLAYTVKWLFSKTLSQKFLLWCNDLKKQSEK